MVENTYTRTSVKGAQVLERDELEHELPDEARRIVDSGDSKALILRVMGACAVRLHSPKFEHLHHTLERTLSDLDFAAYSKQAQDVRGLFVDMGYTPNERVNALLEGKRQIYLDKERGWTADVFFDRLEMCHTIDFRGRLKLDYPTITLSDILLEKMQIVALAEKDIKDTIVLLREHLVGEEEKETVNCGYIAKLLADDWGFYHTTTTNLGKVRNFLSELTTLTEQDREDVTSKINETLKRVEAEPKTLRWRMRARVGTSRKWYREVEEVVR